MGRLIDADKIKTALEEAISKNEDMDCLDFLRISSVIDAHPTAYDPDKVVKQLEEMRSLYQRLSELKDRDHMKYIYKIEALNDAIEIVKGGGVNEIN